jgi:hypothetical protein
MKDGSRLGLHMICAFEATKRRTRRFVTAAMRQTPKGASHMNGIIYLVGLVVVILAILSFFGLR